MTTNTLSAWLMQVKLPTGNFLRELMSCTLNWIMEEEVATLIGARPHQRRSQRSNQRNGYRKRGWKTCVGYLELLIPKLRKGSYFPQFLKRRCLVEETLLGVVREAWVQGVSTRSMKRLAGVLGTPNLSRSQVSRICRELDQRVQEFRQRPIKGDGMFLWLDATYLKVRLDGHVRSVAVLIALGVDSEGRREVLGLDVVSSESRQSWSEFLRSLQHRGLKPVRLIISDEHEGLKAAIAAVMPSRRQRCRVHFMRNLLVQVPRSDQTRVAELIRSAFRTDEPETARESSGTPANPAPSEAHRPSESPCRWQQVADQLAAQYPQVSETMIPAQNDVLASQQFPLAWQNQLHSTNPIERLNREIKRRTDAVGVFPDVDSILRLVGTLLLQQNRQWQNEKNYLDPGAIRQIVAGA